MLPKLGRCAVLGVLNVTPDSFSDGGRFLDAPTSTGNPSASSTSNRRSRVQLWPAFFAKPRPGSSTSSAGSTPASTAASTRATSSARTSPSTSS